MDSNNLKIFDAASDEVVMPSESLLVNGSEYKALNIADSINADVVSNRIVRKVAEDMLLPNILIDLRGMSDVQISEYAAYGLSSLERKDGDTHVYLGTDNSIEKVMMTSFELKEVVGKAIRDLVSEEVKAYENVSAGEKLVRIGGKGLKVIRLDL